MKDQAPQNQSSLTKELSHWQAMRTSYHVQVRSGPQNYGFTSHSTLHVMAVTTALLLLS